MSEEDIDEGEWALTQILANPVLFREFLNEGVEGWEPLEDHERAWSTCTKTYQAFCCGRSVRKTTGMIEMMYWWMINRMFISGDQGLFVLVPNQAQKNLIFFRIRQACLTHWLMRQFVNVNSINQTDGRIDFYNGFQLLMRIAGAAGNDGNVIGLHTYRIWVDEAQAVPWNVWQSLQNCLRVEIPGHQLIVSGVPNGGRQENVLYECDTNPDYLSFNIAQTMMHWWNDDVQYKRRREYHALVEDSEDYKHFVLGQHGLPTYSVFDRARFLIEDWEDERYIKQVLTQSIVDSCRHIDTDGVSRYHFEEIMFCPPVPTEFGRRQLVGVGWDVGFSPDPTVWFVMIQNANGTWRNLTRFVLQRVEYPIQTEMFAWLDKVYKFNFLGIDMGNTGKNVYQTLTYEHGDFTHQHFADRLYPVEFGGMQVVAVDEQGNEKKDLIKRIAVSVLSRWVHEKRFSFSKDDNDLMTELERTKFSRTIAGEAIYRTENDHQMSAMMCALMAYENKYGIPVIQEKEDIKPKLLSAKWFDPFVGVS